MTSDQASVLSLRLLLPKEREGTVRDCEKDASDSLLTLAPGESRQLLSIYLSMMAVARVTDV